MCKLTDNRKCRVGGRASTWAECSWFIEQDNGLETQTPGACSEPGDAGMPVGGDDNDENEGEIDGPGDNDGELRTCGNFISVPSQPKVLRFLKSLDPQRS